DCWIYHHISHCLLLIVCCVITQSHETHYNSANFAALLSSLPALKRYGGESKITRRSPLNLGYVVGLGNVHHTLSHHETTINHGVSKVPQLLSKVQSHSISPSLAHTLLSHNSKPALTHASRIIAHDLTVTHPTSRHSIMKVVSVPKTSSSRDLNHGPVGGLEHLEHSLVPAIAHVTSLTEHGPKTILDHTLLPVVSIDHKQSHGVSKQSTLTLTPECLTQTTVEVNHGEHVSPEHALSHDESVSHALVHKVSTITHDPDALIAHDVTVTHITDGVLLTPVVEHKSVHHNIFRTHLGGYGVGIDFGGHGGGHGFYV
ncbi:hypothetical protein L9F63_012286, partial [Diploptera punctata]